MERAVEVFAVIQLAIIGVSHVVFPREWARFFIWLRERGLAGAFANGFTSLAFGSVVVAFHPVWSGIPLVLTVFGLLNLAKAAVCFLLPERALRSMRRVSLDRSREFIVAGVVSLVVATVSAYGLVVSA
jgi:hypothetical protein